MKWRSLPLIYPPLEPFWTSLACRKMCFSSLRRTWSDPLDGCWRIDGFVSGGDRMPQTSRRKSSSGKSSWKFVVAPFQVVVIIVVAAILVTWSSSATISNDDVKINFRFFSSKNFSWVQKVESSSNRFEFERDLRVEATKIETLDGPKQVGIPHLHVRCDEARPKISGTFSS